MTPANAHHEALLSEIFEADQVYRRASKEEHRRAKAEANARILAFKVDRDKLVFKASEAGISQRQIGLVGLSTSARETTIAAIEHGAQFAPVAEIPAADEAPAQAGDGITIGYDATEEIVTVAIAAEAFDKYAPVTGLRDEDEAYTFVVEDGLIIAPDEDSQHPVVLAVYADKALLTRVRAAIQTTGA